MEGLGTYPLLDAVQHPFEIAEHIARGDPIDIDAPQAEPFRASAVVGNLVRMLVKPPVDLYGQPRLVAVEVEDVGADRMLAAKPHSAEPTTAQSSPEHHFRQRQPSAKLLRPRYGQLRRFHKHNL